MSGFDEVYKKMINKLGKKDRYDFADISYVLDIPLNKVKSKYEKGFKKIQRIVELYNLLDNLPYEKYSITIKNLDVVNILVANLRQMFPIKHISEANIHISSKVILWLLTQDYKTLHFIFGINPMQYKEIVRLIQRS